MGMKYVAAYMMCVLGGNENPKTADVTKVLSSVGLEVDESTLDQLLKNMEGKQTHEVISTGMTKIQAMPAGGGGGGGGAAAAGGAPAAAGGAPAAASKEPEKEESEDEGDLGFSLFD
eukprot:GHVN01013471.1.p4 GENE.GHVN01013471.1~~GHVN01013471.1.p4  ORF type:complete len:117 (+),score=30.57 GHVN01013471.1:92-442(+)